MTKLEKSDILRRVRESDRMRDLLFDLCEFEVAGPKGVTGWFEFDPPISFEIIGKDAAGGFFVHTSGADGRVFFVSSEGKAGCVGETLDQFFSIISAVPYWSDCLHFSGGGKLSEMERVVPILERDSSEEIPDFEEVRTELIALLGVSKLSNPLQTLHDVIQKNMATKIVAASHRSPCESLFGKFVLEDNPMWKK